MSMPAEHLQAPMTLAQLLEGIAAAPDTPVHGMTLDSRRLEGGDLFIARAGDRSHGLDYLEAVVAAGAAAVVFDPLEAGERHVTAGIPVVPVAGLAAQLGTIANRFYDSPSAAVDVIGVTGTNGKTTVAWLLRQCLSRLDKRCGYIGTLGTGLLDVAASDTMTTPDAIELHARLAELRDAGADCAAIEVSSHALDQDRIAGISFDTVVFTNLSRDHLDYHGTMRRYADAKARLFTAYPARHRVINLDSEFGAEIAARCGEDVVTVSTTFDRVSNGRPYVFVRAVVAGETGSEVNFSSSWGDGRFTVSLPGEFNVANAATVLACLLTRGVPRGEACRVLASVVAPPGRMQRVEGSDRLPAVYVDYAHTPDALAVALSALRAHCRGQLWCVFGCGGERDAGKRPLMGQVAERRAQHVVVTSDNPRGEAADTIIAAVLGGMSNTRAAVAIEDRATAIAWTIASAKPSDCVLIAGKGHEDYQLVGAERRAFSDYEAAAAALAARAGNGE